MNEYRQMIKNRRSQMLTPQEFQKRLASIRCFALDMDGTIYLGNSLFPWTLPFLETVKQTGRQFLFLTNNSSRGTIEYVEKLRRLGMDVAQEHIYTSADATLEYISKVGSIQRIYVLGTKPLINFFEVHGFIIEADNPDAVVLGFDLDFDYSRMHQACKLLRRGVPFFATHPDLNCPVENGDMMPDCGALAAALTAATGVKPKILGKPHAPMVEGMLARLGLRRDEIVIVGDRLMTDIAMGSQHKILTILVLSGETCLKDLQQSEVQPDFVIPSLRELKPYLT